MINPSSLLLMPPCVAHINLFPTSSTKQSIFASDVLLRILLVHEPARGVVVLVEVVGSTRPYAVKVQLEEADRFTELAARGNCPQPPYVERR